jgi:hypothetical protein
MSNRQLLEEELREVPEALLGEIVDFVRFVKAKRARQTSESALLSESALAKDWLRPEEDEAWRDL